MITPLFLFGGTFFPLDRLPAVLQLVAWMTPLAHGVALSRGLALGTITPGAATIHVLVPVLYIVAGTTAAVVLLRRRMVK